MDFDSQVVGGLEFLKLIERVATDDKDRPTSEAMRCERVLLRWDTQGHTVILLHTHR